MIIVKKSQVILCAYDCITKQAYTTAFSSAYESTSRVGKTYN